MELARDAVDLAELLPMSGPGKAINRRTADLEMEGFGELTDERAVLAEFADEAVLRPLGRATMIETAPVVAKASAGSCGARIPLLPLLDPRAPLVPVLWTVLIGCISAMAFGASFAIGFKYIWTDRPNPPRADAVETFPLRSSSHGSFFVPHRPAVESERPMAGTIVNERAQPSEIDANRANRAKRAKGDLRWIRRTIAAADLSPLPPIAASSLRGLRLLS